MSIAYEGKNIMSVMLSMLVVVGHVNLSFRLHRFIVPLCSRRRYLEEALGTLVTVEFRECDAGIRKASVGRYIIGAVVRTLRHREWKRIGSTPKMRNIDMVLRT